MDVGSNPFSCTGWRTCRASSPPGQACQEIELPYSKSIGALKFFPPHAVDKPVDPKRQHDRAHQQDQAVQAEIERIQEPQPTAQVRTNRAAS